MGGDGVSDVSAGADEGDGRLVNGGRSYIGIYWKVGSLWGRRLILTMSWRRFGIFWKVMGGGRFGKKVLG